ncbi:hypothetical protein ACTOJ1_000856 [Shigella flexneri]
MNAKHISDYYWDALLPVRTDKIAAKLGFIVQPIDMTKNPQAHLIVSLEHDKPIIYYNKNDKISDIRKVIAIGIAKIVSLHISLKETLVYGKDVFIKKDSLTHMLDVEMANKIVVPYEAIDVLVTRTKCYNIGELAQAFDVSEYEMYKRLKETRFLP